MIKKLRVKFVTVNMLFMVIVFGALYLALFLYNDYWTSLETHQMLELVADSGIFAEEYTVNYKGFSENRKDDPIIGVVSDETGKILSVNRIGNDETSIDERLIHMILANDPSKWRQDPYIYSIRDTSDGNKLIVLVNTDYPGDSLLKNIGSALLVILGLSMLVAVSFLLSRFVTEPTDRTSSDIIKA